MKRFTLWRKYFFVSSTTQIRLETSAGIATVGGGYAIAVLAVLIVTHYMPDGDVWRYIEFDNVELGISANNIRVSKSGPQGEIYPLDAKEDQPYQLICYFGPEVATIILNVK